MELTCWSHGDATRGIIKVSTELNDPSGFVAPGTFQTGGASAQLTPDSKRLLVKGEPHGPPQMVDLASQPPTLQPVSMEPVADTPVPSPDGTMIASCRMDRGVLQLFIRTFSDVAHPAQVSVQGGNYPRWARDGKPLFFIEPDDAVHEVSIIKGPTGEIAIGDNALPVKPGHKIRIEDASYLPSHDGKRFLIAAIEESSPRPPPPVPLRFTGAGESTRNSRHHPRGGRSYR